MIPVPSCSSRRNGLALLVLLLVMLTAVCLVGVCGAALPTADYSQNISSSVGTATVLFNDTSDVFQVTNTSWLFSNINMQPTINIPFPSGWGWATAPISIQKNASNYSTNFDITSYRYTGTGKTYYVNVSGSDANDGLTVSTSFRKLNTALAKPDYDIIYVADGDYNRLQSSGGSVISRSVSIIGTGNNVNLTGFFEPLSWVKNGTYSSTYNVSRSVVAGIYDSSVLDSNGGYTKYTLKTSAALVDATAGSYFIAPNNLVFVHMLDGGAPGTNIRVVADEPCLQQNGNTTLYLARINVLGGGNSGVIYSSNSGSGQTPNIYLNAVTIAYSASGNGLTVKGTTNAYSQNSIAQYNAMDGFNYHSQNNILPSAIEVSDIGRFNGVGNSDQGSSAHDGSSIIRVGGQYYGNSGPNVEEVNLGTKTILVNITAYSSPLYDYIFDDNATAWIYGSSGRNSPNSMYTITNGLAVVSYPNFTRTTGTNIFLSEQNIRYFSSPGVFTINHSVTNSSGTSWKNGTFEVLPNPITATFTPSGPLSTQVGTTVSFTDTSTGSPTTWNWTYRTNNAGPNISFSTSQNPTFYGPLGNHTIHLNISTPSGYFDSAQLTWVNVTANTTSPYASTFGYCQNRTGNITLNLQVSTDHSLRWNWSRNETLVQGSLDSLFIPIDFDNSTPNHTASNLDPESWHAFKIYNSTEWGKLECRTNATIAPEPTPWVPIINPSVDSECPWWTFGFWC